MISVYRLKTRFQGFLRPVCGQLAAYRVTPNQITVAALVSSVLYGAGLFFYPVMFLFLPVFLLFRMGLNALDGMLAREYGLGSQTGMILNELGDVLADVALILPFAALLPAAVPFVVSFVVLAILTEFCGVLAFMVGGVRRYDGPMGKSDRAVALGGFAFLIGIGVSVSSTWVSVVFALMSLMCVWTCFNRLMASVK